MTFQKRMEDVAKRVDGFAGAAVADSDGIILEEYAKAPSLDLSLLVAEYGSLWNGVDKAGLACEIGSAREITVFTEVAILLIRKISAGYFLIFVVNLEESVGKGRFYARIVAENLVEELAL